MTSHFAARDAARTPRAVQAEKLGLGIALIVVGSLWTLHLLGLARFGPIHVLWPIFVIAPGLARLLMPGRRLGGLFMIGLGLLFLAHTTGVARMGQTWPLFLVLGGSSMVARVFEVRFDSSSQSAADEVGRRV